MASQARATGRSLVTSHVESHQPGCANRKSVDLDVTLETNRPLSTNLQISLEAAGSTPGHYWKPTWSNRANQKVLEPSKNHMSDMGGKV
jgi:hypothetical protein